MDESSKGAYVLVTTEFRGVFFGKLKSVDDTTTTLTEAQNCISWSEEIKGFLGLAATGPNSNCRVGPPVPELVLYKTTSISQCTSDAVQAWKNQPWKS